MNDSICKDCQYFMQHYTFNSRKIFCVYCGHCTTGTARRRRPDAKACEKFVLRASQEDAFVSKEYLSKELLQYVLSLELIPEIEDSADR